MSFLIGSLLLFDVDKVGFDIPYSIIIPTVLVFGGVSLGFSYLAAQSVNKKNHDWDQQFLNADLQLMEISENKKSGKVQVAGEIWQFETDTEVTDIHQFAVVKRNHLTLILKKKINT